MLAVQPRAPLDVITKAANTMQLPLEVEPAIAVVSSADLTASSTSVMSMR